MSNPFIPVIQKPIYRAPEVFLNQKNEDNEKGEVVRYNESADLWSVAVIIHRAVTGKLFCFPVDKSPYGHFEISTIVHRIGMPEDSYLQSLVSTDKFFKKLENGRFALKDELAAFPKRTSLADAHKEAKLSTPELFDFLSKALVWDPAKRISAEQALQLPVFSKK